MAVDGDRIYTTFWQLSPHWIFIAKESPFYRWAVWQWRITSHDMGEHWNIFTKEGTLDMKTSHFTLFTIFRIRTSKAIQCGSRFWALPSSTGGHFWGPFLTWTHQRRASVGVHSSGNLPQVAGLVLVGCDNWSKRLTTSLPPLFLTHKDPPVKAPAIDTLSMALPLFFLIATNFQLPPSEGSTESEHSIVNNDKGMGPHKQTPPP